MLGYRNLPPAREETGDAHDRWMRRTMALIGAEMRRTVLAASIVMPPPSIIVIGDPFVEEIRLRVRWGWQDATAREGLPGGGDAGRA
jgi:hypothetical protein